MGVLISTKQKKTRKKSRGVLLGESIENNYYDRLQTELENAQMRIRAVGEEPDKKEFHLLPAIFEALRRTDYAATNLLRELIPGKQGDEDDVFDPISAFIRGLKGEERITGKELVSEMGLSDKPLFEANIGPVKIAPSLAGIVGFGVEALNPLNPLNWLTFGAGKALTSGAKGLAKEAGEELAERSLRHGITAQITNPLTGRVVGETAIPGTKKIAQALTPVAEAVKKSSPYQKLAKSFSTKYVPEDVPEKVLARTLKGKGKKTRSELDKIDDLAKFIRQRKQKPPSELEYAVKQADELKKTLEEMERAYLDTFDEYTAEKQLYDAIRKRGGIKIEPGNAFYTEFKEALPLSARRTLIRKSGIPIDEMAAELGMDTRTLLDKLRDVGMNYESIKRSGRRKPTLEEISDELYKTSSEYKGIYDTLEFLQDKIDELRKKEQPFEDTFKEVSGKEAFVDIRKAREAIEQMARGEIDKVDTEIRQLFKPLTKQERELITDAVGRRDSSQLPEKLIPYYKSAVDSLESWRKQLKGAGILEREMEQYVPFIHTGKKLTAKEKQLLQEKFGTGIKIFGDLDDVHEWYAKFIPNIRERTTKAVTPREVNEILGKKFFEEDIAEILSIYSSRAVKAEAAKQFFDATIAKYGLRIDDLKKLKQLPEGYGLYRVVIDPETGQRVFEPVRNIFEKISGDVVALPKEFVNHINEYQRAFFDPTMQGTIWEFFDNINRIFKTTAYLWNPGHIPRDAASNAFQLWLMGMKNPVRYIDAINILKGKKFIPKGLRYSSDEILQMARDYGLIGTEMISAEFRRDIARNAYTDIMARATRFVDDSARLAGFIDQLAKGLSPEQAAIQVKKYLFDYFELTPFERKWMKRFIPFYTWTRKNLPLQFKELMRQPGKYAAVARAHDYISEEYTEKDVPDWIKENVAVLLPGIPGRRQYYISNLPYMDMATTPRDILSMVTPIVRTPFELATGVKTFSGTPIQNKLEYGIGQFIPIIPRITTMLDRENPKRNARILTTLGLPPTYEEESIKKSAMFEQRDKYRQIIDELKEKGIPVPTIKELSSKKNKKQGVLI